MEQQQQRKKARNGRSRGGKIGLRDADRATYKAWARSVDRFFSSYRDVKDDMFRALTKDEERELILRYRDDRPSLEEQLMRHNIFLAVNLASKYSAYGTDYDELLSAAMYGLNVAARKFDVERGTKFSTHAVWWIRKHILMALSGSRYDRNIGSRVSLYLDSDSYDRDTDNYNYTTLADSVEPTFLHTFHDAKTPYEKAAEREAAFDNGKLIERITQSVSASSLAERDKNVYVRMFVDGKGVDDISAEMGISKHAIAKSRSRLATFISENFGGTVRSV